MGRLVAMTAVFCVACSSAARPVCGPCPYGQTITVLGADPRPGDRLRVCVGERPCVDRPAQRDGDALRFLLDLGPPDRLANLPVRVVTGARQGSGVMRYVHQDGPCPCSYAYATITVG